MSYVLYQQLHRPTSVESAASGHITSRDAVNLVVGTSTSLRVFTLLRLGDGGGDARAKLVVEAEHALQGELYAVRVLHGCGRIPGTDAILISLQQAKVCILVWDPATAQLRTASMHYFERPELRAGHHFFKWGPAVRVDPGHRVASVCVYDRHMAFLPLPFESLASSGHVDPSTPLASGPSSQLVALESVGVQNLMDWTFLHGYGEPTLLVLHEHEPRSWAGRAAVSRTTCAITAFTHAAGSSEHPVIWSYHSLLTDCIRVQAMPEPLGGVVVFSTNIIMYYNEVCQYGLGVNRHALASPPFNIDHAPLGITLDASQSCVLSPAPSEAAACLLLSLADGDLYTLLFIAEGRMVVKIEAQQCGTASLSSVLCPIDRSPHLFLGSRVGDSLLIHYELQESVAHRRMAADTATPVKVELVGSGDAEAAALVPTVSADAAMPGVEDIFAMYALDAAATPAFPGGGGGGSVAGVHGGRAGQQAYVLHVADSLVNVGPIRDITIGTSLDPASASNAPLATKKLLDLVTASGHDRNGALSVLHQGIRPDIFQPIPMANTLATFSVRAGPAVVYDEDAEAMVPAHDSYLLLSQEEATQVVATGRELEELGPQDVDFVMNAPTILAANLGERIVQVYPHGWTLFAGGSALQRQHFFNPYRKRGAAPQPRQCVVAALTEYPYLVCVMGDGHLRLYCMLEKSRIMPGGGEIEEITLPDSLGAPLDCDASPIVSACVFRNGPGEPHPAFVPSAAVDDSAADMLPLDVEHGLAVAGVVSDATDGGDDGAPAAGDAGQAADDAGMNIEDIFNVASDDSQDDAAAGDEGPEAGASAAGSGSGTGPGPGGAAAATAEALAKWTANAYFVLVVRLDGGLEIFALNREPGKPMSPGDIVSVFWNGLLTKGANLLVHQDAVRRAASAAAADTADTGGRKVGLLSRMLAEARAKAGIRELVVQRMGLRRVPHVMALNFLGDLVVYKAFKAPAETPGLLPLRLRKLPLSMIMRPHSAGPAPLSVARRRAQMAAVSRGGGGRGKGRGMGRGGVGVGGGVRRDRSGQPVKREGSEADDVPAAAAAAATADPAAGDTVDASDGTAAVDARDAKRARNETPKVERVVRGDADDGAAARVPSSVPYPQLPAPWRHNRLVRWGAGVIGRSTRLVGGGVFVTGNRGCWIVCDERDTIHAWPMDHGGSAVLCFAPFHNVNCPHGFVFVTQDESLKIAQLPGSVAYDNAWPVRKVPLAGWTPHSVQWHGPSKSYVVVVSQDVVGKPDVQGDVPPRKTKWEVHLLDGRSFTTLDTVSMEADEVIMMARVLLLNPQGQRYDMGAARKPMLCVVTAFNKGEDVGVEGRLRVYDISPRLDATAAEGVGGSTMHEQGFVMRQVAQRKERGPMTACCAMQGYLISCIGSQVMMFFLHDAELTGCAFWNGPTFVTDLQATKNYLMVTCHYRSAYFLTWRVIQRQLVLLSADAHTASVCSANFLMHDGSLSLVTADNERNVRLLAYDPTSIESMGGQQLLVRADFHLGSAASRMIPIQLHRFGDEAESDTGLVRREDGQLVDPKNGLLLAHRDGSISVLLPMPERDYKRLSMLCQRMERELRQLGGLNPRDFRAFHTTVPQARVHKNDVVLDADLLMSYAHMDAKKQEHLARVVGTTPFAIVRNLLEVQMATLLF